MATLLAGVHDGSLPPIVSLYRPPGTGKTQKSMVGFHTLLVWRESILITGSFRG